MTLWTLFFCFLKIGLFSIGGGYVAIPLIRSQTVDVYGWLTEGDGTEESSGSSLNENYYQSSVTL